MKWIASHVAVAALTALVIAGAAGARLETVPPILLDERHPPDAMQMVMPGKVGYAISPTTCRPGPERFARVAVYRWNGHAFGVRRVDRDGQYTFWRDPGNGERVVFDGSTVDNNSHRRALVAAWC